MKKILLFSSLVILSLSNSIAQTNLVPNSSFENFSTCPNFSGQINYVNNWNNVNMVYGSFSYGTPDYYNTCSSSNYADLPSNLFANLNAFDGSGVMGLVIYNYDLVDYREYISTQLSQPLNTENTYTVKLRMTGGTAQNYRFHSYDFGIVFSESPLTQNTWSIVSATPQIQLDTMLNTSTWKEYSFTYTPDKAYSYITLGSFNHDADINVQDVTSSVNKYSYVFIDALEVKAQGQTSVNEINQSVIKVSYQNNKLNVFNPENKAINLITIFDAQGKIIQSSNKINNTASNIELTAELSSGVYFAQINSDQMSNAIKFVVSK